MRFSLLLILQVCLFAADFDCVVVGSSPFSLFEALYQSQSGKKVLILEEAAECGGAWKTITACGIPRADLGCHQIGHDLQLKTFLEEYAGCKLVSLDNPLQPFEAGKGANGYYFSQGCFELIDHLLYLISKTDIVLLTNTRVENFSLDMAQSRATVYTKERSYTTDRLVLTQFSSLYINNIANQPQNWGKSKHFHLYLLLQDPTPPRFSYCNSPGNGISRLMNLTYFVGIAETGRQLIVIQTHSEQNLKNSAQYIDLLKAQGLVDSSAYLLKEEPVIYEAGGFQQGLIAQMGAGHFIEVLQTGHFQSLSNYISRWKQTLKPYTAGP